MPSEETSRLHIAMGTDGLLITLAEECAELSQACCKLWRSYNGQTPVDIDKCMAALIEETADVALMIDMVADCLFTGEQLFKHWEVYSQKYDRMKQRLLKEGEHEHDEDERGEHQEV